AMGLNPTGRTGRWDPLFELARLRDSARGVCQATAAVLRLLCFSATIVWILAQFRTTAAERHAGQTNNRGHDSTQEHPYRLVCGRTRKEPGNIGAKRVDRLNSEDNQNDTANQQSQR